MSKFELDPKRDKVEHVTGWEDVGALDNLNMRNFMHVLRKEHGVSINKKSFILEIGVGKAKLFSRLKKEGYMVSGVEARKRPEHTPDLPIANIRIEELPFGEDTAQFDMIIASFVFDTGVYDQDDKLMITRIADALRPGGILLCGYIADFDEDIPKHPKLQKLTFKTPGYVHMLAFKKV